MANSFTVTANSPTSVTASGSWRPTDSDFFGNGFITENYLRILYKPSTSSTFTTFATGGTVSGTNEASVSHTNTSMTPSTTYNFRLVHYYFVQTFGGGGGIGLPGEQPF